ncbi:MAG: hypothetical protein ACKV2T_04130 [Kofleriaceae bacterium]
MILRAAVVCLLLGGVASAAPRRGVVELTSSRWSGDMIVTDVVVRGDDGSRATFVEHGGSVSGIGMSVSHRTVPRAGDAVRWSFESSIESSIDGRTLTAVRPVAPTTTIAATAVGIGVQRTSRSDKPLYHPTGCVNFELDAKGSAKVEGEWNAVDAAFAAWESASAGMECGGVRFTTRIVQDAPDGHDGVNTIHIRDTTWCRPGTVTDPEVCHSPEAVAVTRVLYVDEPSSPRDGEIIEVDIDVNAVGFTLATDGRASAIDLQSAATHEIGHALGLDHNCGVEDGAWPADRDGTPVPSCESVPPDLATATMYVQVTPGDTNMRTPKVSDTRGLCDAAGGTCEAEVTGGCSAGGGTSGLGFALALLALRRRRG